MKFLPILLCLLSPSVIPIEAARILVLAPMSTRSHLNGFIPIVEELAKRGHEITTISGHAMKLEASKNVRKIVLKDLAEYLEEDWQSFQRDSIPVALFKVMNEFRTLNTKGYETLKTHQEFQEILRSRQIDLIIVDAIVNEFTLPFVDQFDVPYIYYSPSAGPPWVLDALNVPGEYSTIPAVSSDQSGEMSFTGRLLNMLSTEAVIYFRKVFVLNMLDNLVREDFPEARSIRDIERDAELCLANIDPATARPRPLPPTMIPVGALHCRPAKPLTDELQSFADGAEEGFIVFTLGSNAKVSSMPENYKEIFVRVFARLPQRVFWKWEKASLLGDSLSPNVKIINWLPQQDLLGHPNARLFMSHGGLLGTQEAVYHGVPILGLPLGRDQPHNLAKANEEGYGVKLEWEKLTESNLYETLQRVLHQPSFRGNATRLSRLMKDEMIAGKDVAAYWVEHVLRHGGAKHLQSRAKNTPFYQYHLLDVWIFLCFTAIIALYINHKILTGIGQKIMLRFGKVKTQ